MMTCSTSILATGLIERHETFPCKQAGLAGRGWEGIGSLGWSDQTFAPGLTAQILDRPACMVMALTQTLTLTLFLILPQP